MKKKLSKADKEYIRVLQYATELIKKGWTRNAFAVNKHNQVVQETSKRACRFCASGALRRATADLKKSPTLYYSLKFFVEKHLEKKETLPVFNDRQKSKRPVIKLFEQVIAFLEGATTNEAKA